MYFESSIYFYCDSLREDSQLRRVEWLEERERLQHQAGEDSQKIDYDFVETLESGMPSAGGIGIGIDRLCMLMTGASSIRDIILFPQLKNRG